MSKKKVLHNRLGELFSGDPPPQPERAGSEAASPGKRTGKRAAFASGLPESAAETGFLGPVYRLANEAARCLGQAEDPAELVASAAQLLRTHLGVDEICFYLPGALPGPTGLPAGSDLPAPGFQVLSRDQAAGIVAETFGHGESIAAASPLVDAPEGGVSHYELSIPLAARGECQGVLWVAQDRPSPFTGEEHLACQTLGAYLAAALERARLAEELRLAHQAAAAEAQHLRAEVAQVQAQIAESRRQAAHATWQEYLDAIRHSEEIGFSFDQQDVQPLQQPLFTPNRPEVVETPLVVGGEVLGELQVEGKPETWGPNENDLLQNVVRQVSQHIENLRLVEQAEQFRQEAEYAARRLTRQGWEEFLNAIERSETIGFQYDQKYVQALDVLPVSDENGTTLEKPILVLGEPVGTFQVANEPDKTLTPEQAHLVERVVQQVGQQVENLRLLARAERFRKDAEQATRRLTHTGWQTYLEEGAISHAGFIYDQNQVQPLPAGEPGTLAASAVQTYPIRVREEAVGELSLDLPDASDPLAEDLLLAVIERLGIHIESLRLLDETERGRQQLNRRAAELETVARVSTAAAKILTPHELLQTVVDLTKNSFNLYHAHVYLLDESGHNLVLGAGAGKIGDEMRREGQFIPVYEPVSMVAAAARRREVIVANDARSFPLFLPHPMLPATQSELAMPLVVGDRLVGVFDVQSEHLNRFTQDDMRIYQTLAAQVSVALQNAELYAEQKATVERLRELDHLKTSFLANMSHELRTPLNSILGFTQVLLEELDGPLTPNMVNDLQLIEKNGNHLLQLINEVLDMAKIEAGRVSLSQEWISPMHLLEDVLEITGPLAREKALYLRLEPLVPMNFQVYVDRTRMRQVLINLVGNAVKFTDHGGITLRVEEVGVMMRLSVIDTGLGIPPEKLEAIFEAFSQVDTSTTRKVGGTGLGLPISRKLIELHGGRLWAESDGETGNGSAFILEIPLNPSLVEGMV